MQLLHNKLRVPRRGRGEVEGELQHTRVGEAQRKLCTIVTRHKIKQQQQQHEQQRQRQLTTMRSDNASYA